MKRVKSAWLFPNGIVACCGVNDEQIPELQGPYNLTLYKRIAYEALPDCEWKGFDDAPYFDQSAVDLFMASWNRSGLSWEELQKMQIV